ncbi:MAG: hypothetical protein MJZ81_09305 [Bacteroidales bacterium]|nr:hypothetical protein [Bacteroidales bacterium]
MAKKVNSEVNMSAACEAAAKVHAYAATFLVDLLNADPFGACTQFLPDLISKAATFQYVVMDVVDDLDVCNGVAESFRHGVCPSPCGLHNVDKIASEAFFSIVVKAKSAIAYLGDLATDELKEAYKELVEEIESCDRSYFQTGFKA